MSVGFAGRRIGPTTSTTSSRCPNRRLISNCELSQLGNIDAAIEAINNAIAKGFRKPAPAFTNGNAAPAPARKGQTAADVENLPCRQLRPTLSMTAPSRLLPHSLEAEECLLSCCMMEDADTLAMSVAAGITPDSFYDPKHAVIYASLCRLLHASKPVAIHVLAEELKTSRELEAVGGYAVLAQVSRVSPTTAQAGYYVEKVIEMATLRALIRSATKAVEDSYAWTGVTFTSSSSNPRAA